MKKFMVSLIAVLATVGTSMAAETCNGGCKPKRHRVIYVSAHDPETMYGDAVYDTTVLSGDGSSSSQAVYQELALQPVRIEPANWYVGGRLSLHMLNWKNKYRATPDSDQLNKEFDHDDYTFEPLFGGGIFAGYHFGESWRGDAEFGYITRFTDSDNGFTFKLSTPYILANAYYNIHNGLYIGAGLGLAFPRMSMDWAYFVQNSGAKTATSFMGGLSLGYEYYLSDVVAIDFRYRFAGFMGPKLTRGVSQTDPLQPYDYLESIETKIGFIMDNSFSIGIRYEF